MSGWTTLTLRGLYSEKYEHGKYDEKDPNQANSDLIVSLKNDSRIHEVGYWNGHVYASLSTGRYSWETAEDILEALKDIAYDAVVIGANDTSDTGTSRYYPLYDSWSTDGRNHTDSYQETQSEDGTPVGAIAAAVMTARHGIVAQERMAFRATGEHYTSGVLDYHLEKGRDML